MEATISLNNVLSFLNSLPLSSSNKQWLGERLIEEARAVPEEKEQSYEDFIDCMCGVWNDDPRTAEEIAERK